MIDDELLPPDEAFDAAVSHLEELQERAEQILGDGTTVGPETIMANATNRMAMMVIRKLAKHWPVYADHRWECSVCVEMRQMVTLRAAAPCAEARDIFEMLGVQLQEAAPGGLQMIVQDGAEPYVSLGAAELERMFRLPEQESRSYASIVVRAIAGIRTRARHY